MKKLFTLFTSLFLLVLQSNAQQNPAITSWIINTNGHTGYGGIPTNVQQVQYSANNVYVSTTDIADWIPVGYIWPHNPNYPANKDFVFKITLNPVKNNDLLVKTPLGHIGIWTNGVSIYNAKDARSYIDSGKWFQNAIYFEHLETESMDSCLGHPNDKHEYHLHMHPKCLWDDTDSTHHAPLLGFAFDGFPIYGCYSYTNTDGTGPVKRLKSSYRLRNITDRTTLPDGTILSPVYYGPATTTFPLGAYIEDYEYVPGLGNLDEHNGRFCVTPEYPDGTYAYFATIDGHLEPSFPYVLGPDYYGTVQNGNLGPGSGKNVITEPVNVYTSVNDIDNQVIFLLYPNPARENVTLFLIPSYNCNMTAVLYDVLGRKVKEINNIQTAVNYTLDISSLPNGQYILEIGNGVTRENKKIVINH